MSKPINLMAVLLICAALLPGTGSPFLSASAAPLLASAPPMATATKAFAVLGGATVTNTGASSVSGDLGVSPGPAVTGFASVDGGLGTVTGAIHLNDGVAQAAQTDVAAAYVNLAGQNCDTVLSGQDLGGKSLAPGVYCFATSAQLTGHLELDAGGDPDAVWVFQIGSTLTTASESSVAVINGGKSCNVWWQVGTFATLGTGTAFVGNILADQSITLTTGASITGAALAHSAAVTMDTNSISKCFGPNAIALREVQATSAAGLPYGLGAGAALLMALGLIVIRRSPGFTRR